MDKTGKKIAPKLGEMIRYGMVLWKVKWGRSKIYVWGDTYGEEGSRSWKEEEKWKDVIRHFVTEIFHATWHET